MWPPKLTTLHGRAQQQPAARRQPAATQLSHPADSANDMDAAQRLYNKVSVMERAAITIARSWRHFSSSEDMCDVYSSLEHMEDTGIEDTPHTTALTFHAPDATFAHSLLHQWEQLHAHEQRSRERSERKTSSTAHHAGSSGVAQGGQRGGRDYAAAVAAAASAAARGTCSRGPRGRTRRFAGAAGRRRGGS